MGKQVAGIVNGRDTLHPSLRPVPGAEMPQKNRHSRAAIASTSILAPIGSAET